MAHGQDAGVELEADDLADEIFVGRVDGGLPGKRGGRAMRRGGLASRREWTGNVLTRRRRTMLGPSAMKRRSRAASSRSLRPRYMAMRGSSMEEMENLGMVWIG